MTEEERRYEVDPRYILADQFKEHCEICKEANEGKRTVIVDNAMRRFERVEGDIKQVDDNLEKYKNAINGKFDWIWRSAIGLLLCIVGSLVSTIWIQHNATANVENKFKVLIEGRALHQNISQENNNDLTIVLRRLSEMEGMMTDTKRALDKKEKKVDK